jgi:flagellar operon protein
MAKNINNILIPNVTSIPGKQGNVDKANQLKQGQQSEFKSMLQDQISSASIEHGINLSVHAAKRLHERSIDIDSDEYMKLKEAMGKLKEKGGNDSLVITPKAAYIVDVGNNKIVTAINKESLSENVFTKIDSTLFVN